MQNQMAVNDEKSKASDQIDQNLKRVYQDALSVEVPDRFKDLLKQLREKDQGGPTQ
jgi:hypothetical protein